MKLYPGDIVVSLPRKDDFTYEVLSVDQHEMAIITPVHHTYVRLLKPGEDRPKWTVYTGTLRLANSFLKAVREAREKGLDEAQNGD